MIKENSTHEKDRLRVPLKAVKIINRAEPGSEDESPSLWCLIYAAVGAVLGIVNAKRRSRHTLFWAFEFIVRNDFLYLQSATTHYPL